jgi:hypothetical protein
MEAVVGERASWSEGVVDQDLESKGLVRQEEHESDSKKGVMSEGITKEVTKEGLSEIQVRQLLSEMEMLDENRDDIWGEEEDNQEMEFLPADIIP